MITMTPKQIKNLRDWLKFTQEEFASHIGTTVSTVNRWEAGKNKPSKMAREKMRTLLQVREEKHATKS